jgi:hypothetical protein
MEIKSASSSAAAVSAPSTQSLRQTNQSNQSSETNRLSVANANVPVDSGNNGVQQTQRVQAAQPTVNTQGQTIGSTINETV